MTSHYKRTCLLVIALLTLFSPVAFAQQEANELRITLRRDFGAAIGNRISGAFSILVNDPPTAVTRVVFLLDDTTLGEDDSPPFRLQFRTTNFEPGSRTITAVAYDSNGREVARDAISRTFMSSGESTNTLLWVVIPLLILSSGGRLLANWIANRQNPGKPAISGPLGGAICTNCGRPFAFHIWSFNFVIFRVDRCPHCRKWVRVTRASPDILRAVADALEEAEAAATKSTTTDGDIKRRLDDSRFEP